LGGSQEKAAPGSTEVKGGDYTGAATLAARENPIESREIRILTPSIFASWMGGSVKRRLNYTKKARNHPNNGGQLSGGRV